jgi:hypothetical protein
VKVAFKTPLPTYCQRRANVFAQASPKTSQAHARREIALAVADLGRGGESVPTDRDEHTHDLLGGFLERLGLPHEHRHDALDRGRQPGRRQRRSAHEIGDLDAERFREARQGGQRGDAGAVLDAVDGVDAYPRARAEQLLRETSGSAKLSEPGADDLLDRLGWGAPCHARRNGVGPRSVTVTGAQDRYMCSST